MNRFTLRTKAAAHCRAGPEKVSELLGHERFNCSFQIGMLASFESFLETARLKRDDDYLISAFVVRQAVVSSIMELPLQAWIRNRATQLVGFRVDRQGRLRAEAWVPKAGLTAEEFQLYVRRVAAESDRFEYLLTGRDIE